MLWKNGWSPHQTTTLPKWMFSQKNFFKSSLPLNGWCGIQVFRPIYKRRPLRLCLHFCIYPSSMIQKNYSFHSATEVRFLNCSWGRRVESNYVVTPPGPGPGSWGGSIGNSTQLFRIQKYRLWSTTVWFKPQQNSVTRNLNAAYSDYTEQLLYIHNLK